MPFPFLLAAKGLATAAPFLSHLLSGRHRPKAPDYNKINSKYMGMRPEGYVSSGDQRFSDQLLGKGTALAGAQAAEATRGLERRAAPLGYSPAARERAISQINKQKIGQIDDAKFGADSALYGAFNRNQNFERQKMMTGWGAELSGSRDDRARRDLQNSTFWNSAMEFLPNAMKLFGGGGKSYNMGSGDRYDAPPREG